MEVIAEAEVEVAVTATEPESDARRVEVAPTEPEALWLAVDEVKVALFGTGSVGVTVGTDTGIDEPLEVSCAESVGVDVAVTGTESVPEVVGVVTGIVLLTPIMVGNDAVVGTDRVSVGVVVGTEFVSVDPVSVPDVDVVAEMVGLTINGVVEPVPMTVAEREMSVALTEVGRSVAVTETGRLVAVTEIGRSVTLSVDTKVEERSPSEVSGNKALPEDGAKEKTSEE